MNEVRAKAGSELPDGPMKLIIAGLKVSISTISLNVKVSTDSSRSYVYDISDGGVMSAITVAALKALFAGLEIIGLLKASVAKVAS